MGAACDERARHLKRRRPAGTADDTSASKDASALGGQHRRHARRTGGGARSSRLGKLHKPHETHKQSDPPELAHKSKAESHDACGKRRNKRNLRVDTVRWLCGFHVLLHTNSTLWTRCVNNRITCLSLWTHRENKHIIYKFLNTNTTQHKTCPCSRHRDPIPRAEPSLSRIGFVLDAILRPEDDPVITPGFADVLHGFVL